MPTTGATTTSTPSTSARRSLASTATVAVVALAGAGVAVAATPAHASSDAASAVSAEAADPTPTCDDTTCTVTYAATPSVQSFTVPAGVRELSVRLDGAAGGDMKGIGDSLLSAGGLGGRSAATVRVSGGDELSLVVGTRGGSSEYAGPQVGRPGGYGGGGNGGLQPIAPPEAIGPSGGPGGGGGSFLFDDDGALVLAAGGGGGASQGTGGSGGGAEAPATGGGTGSGGAAGGGPGTGAAHGVGGTATGNPSPDGATDGASGSGTVGGPTSLPTGGVGGDGLSPGGGGGGGYFAGGGGSGSSASGGGGGGGGGGGAGFARARLDDVSGLTGVVAGDGSATLSWAVPEREETAVRLARPRLRTGDRQQLTLRGFDPDTAVVVRDAGTRVSPRGARTDARGRYLLRWRVSPPTGQHRVSISSGGLTLTLGYRVVRRR